MASQPPTVTTTALLNALHDPADQRAWFELNARFRPMIEACARSLGLNDDEAEEAGQRAFAEVTQSYRAGKYQRGRGRLRSWIIGITRHVAMDVLRERGRAHRGESAIVNLPDDATLTTVWERQRRQSVLRDAMATLRERTQLDDRTIRAFELYVMHGVPAQEAGRQCGMSIDEVYVAKNRVTNKLQEIVEQIERAYDEDE